jgi:hypothetical protein
MNLTKVLLNIIKDNNPKGKLDFHFIKNWVQIHYHEESENTNLDQVQWLPLEILAAQEVEMRIVAQGQPGQEVSEASSWTIAGHGSMCLASQLWGKYR